MTDTKLRVVKAARDKLAADLDWHGPKGSVMRYVVLEREQALALLEVVEGVLAGPGPAPLRADEP